MVKMFVLAAMLFAATSHSVVARDRCTKGSEFEPPLCPLAMSPIARLVIEENGAKSSLASEASTDCSSFVLTEKLVRRYLSRAKRVPAGGAHSTLDWSPCYASGKVLFKDGRSAQWRVSQLRVGSLSVDGQAEQTLYCSTCKDKPFGW